MALTIFEALGDLQLLSGNLQGIAVGLDDLNCGVVEEPTSENPNIDAVIPVEVTNQRDHLLGCGLLFLPVIEVIIHSRHIDQLPRGKSNTMISRSPACGGVYLLCKCNVHNLFYFNRLEDFGRCWPFIASVSRS